MKKLLILFFVVLNLSILGREVDMEQLKAQNDIMYINGEKEAFTGIARTYFDNGNIKEEIEFKNGMKDGTSKEYARNGSLREEAEFKNGEVNWNSVKCIMIVENYCFLKNGKIMR